MRRRKRHTRALLPALSVTALLLAAGCSSPPAQADHPAPDPGRTRTGEASPAADRPLAVAAAPSGTTAATASPSGSGGRARPTTLTVSSYDSKTRRAVISPKNPRSPKNTGSSSSPAPAKAPHRAAVGDVIASAPAPGAPRGLLAKVTEVVGETDAGTEVRTEPATLDALLGDDTARGTVPVDPAAFDVDKLIPDVDISWAKAGDVHVGPEGATVPLGSLRLDVEADVPTPPGTPVSADASVSGFVQVAPKVDFRYGGQGAGDAPGSAYLGVSGDWTSGWALKGRASASTSTPLRIPFAKLHADPVLQVGPIPVVVNLDLTCYFQISADGSVTVDIRQELKGDFTAGGTFGPVSGWKPVSSADMTSTPVRATMTAAGQAKASLGAEASVGLYGTVGVTADLAPYLRAEAAGKVSTQDGVDGSWAVYGGVDLSGTLRLQLSIFGTPVFQRSIPLGALNREWKLAGTP
ncbi:hypothetical protein F7R91_27490 [Streptomyces luteolifulvus]|uniref:Lipoprotein n=1 Tax=Streptomyces luteolifulvus TaxID=2615112 RepID=A0A6H9UUB6_9ACTN|nr:hypothetical protein [Streptomyces luteolifulvus]KAB1142852.1 hypothetical protein F7R91_27490 [Streptomyces luteolifulvus]